MNPTRDNYIDVVKGLMLLSVINIHTVYWSLARYTPDIMRQLAYFVDIPIFFFISGYLLKRSGFGATAVRFLRQFVRLFFHYAAISLLLAAAVYLWVYLVEDRSLTGVWESLRTIKDVHLRGELWRYIGGYDGSLWYMRVYFSMMLFIPFFVGFRVFERLKVHYLFFMVLFYSLTIYQYRGHTFIFTEYGDVAFYSIFFLLGSIYRLEEGNIRIRDLLLSLTITCLLCWMIYHFDHNQLRLSRYKFPPAYQYLVYSLPLLHVFALIKPGWHVIRDSRFNGLLAPLEWAGRNSYILYLFQGAVCSLPGYFVASLDTSSSVTLYFQVYGFNVGLSLLLTWLYVACAARIKRTAAGVLPGRKPERRA